MLAQVQTKGANTLMPQVSVGDILTSPGAGRFRVDAIAPVQPDGRFYVAGRSIDDSASVVLWLSSN